MSPLPTLQPDYHDQLVKLLGKLGSDCETERALVDEHRATPGLTCRMRFKQNESHASPANGESHSGKPRRKTLRRRIWRLNGKGVSRKASSHAGMGRSLCANEDETTTCRQFTLEGVGQTSRGYAPNQ